MKKVLKVVTNKYFIASVAFVSWTVFFDQNDWISLQQRQKELDGIKGNIKYLNTEIARMNTERTNLLTNPQKLEQYARENYRMKHDGEDVYVIDDTAENNVSANK